MYGGWGMKLWELTMVTHTEEFSASNWIPACECDADEPPWMINAECCGRSLWTDFKLTKTMKTLPPQKIKFAQLLVDYVEESDKNVITVKSLSCKLDCWLKTIKIVYQRT